MFRSAHRTIGLLAVALLVSACGSSSSNADGRVSVVASFYPLAEAAQVVGGLGPSP